LAYEAAAYEVFNLGNDHTIGLVEMVSVLEDALGMRAMIEMKPPVKGDLPRTWASIRKAAEKIGYAPETAFEEGIAKFVEWYLRQQK
jgi:UDP-glucuronate 4-epimerase